MSNPVGRPSKYEDRFVTELIKFFDVEAYREMPILDKEGNTVAIKAVPNKFPTLARFACKIGVTRETLWDWATATDDEGNLIHAEFSNAYKRAKEFQESILVEGAMAGAFQANFSIFTAKNVLGWRDKVEQELSGPGGQPLKTGFLLEFVESNNGNNSGS